MTGVSRFHKPYAKAFEAMLAHHNKRGPLPSFFHGNLYNTFAIDHFVAGISPQVISGKRQGKPMELAVGYVDDLSFNAFATNYDGVDMIAINYGVHLRFRALFYSMLSQPGMFRRVGEASKEAGHRDPAILRAYAQLDPAIIPPPPKDNLRRKLAENLAVLAEHFILAHEWAHIRNGHVDWCSRHNLHLIDEMSIANQEGVSNVDRQTLEWDADARAMQTLLHAATNAQDEPVGDRIFARMAKESHFGGPEFGVMTAGLVAYTCFRLFSIGPVTSGLEELLSRRHPPAPVRMWLNALFSFAWLDNIARVPSEPFNDWIFGGPQVAEKFWGLVNDEEPQPIVSDHVQAVSNDLLERFNAAWKRLHPELDQLKRGGRLAPP